MMKASPAFWSRRTTLVVFAGTLVCLVLSLAGLPILSSPTLAGRRAGRSEELLRNGSFEEAAGWEGRSPERDYGEGRSGSRGLRMEGSGGVWQTLALNRGTASLFRVSGWSRAEGVDGAPDAGYSLYVDLVYDDGTRLEGQAVSFACGTHDWERREMLLPASRPVASLTLHCLFRGHSGKVWFDDVSIEETRPEAGAVLFQGAALRILPQPTSGGSPRRVATADGLELSFLDERIVRVSVDGRDCSSGAPSGFLVRDAAAGSDLFALRRGACEELGLRVASEIEGREDHVSVRGRILDPARRERAVTLVFALPVDAWGWRWGRGPRETDPIDEPREYANEVRLPSGATGTMSRYPLAAISSPGAGLAVAVDPDPPAQVRLAYHAGSRQLLVAYDFGLPAGSDGAGFRFVLYRFDPRWGFRAATARMYALFPNAYAARSWEHGIWMPFLDVGKVRDWQDFGFKYHEGDGNVSFDDAQGILSFRYLEPMTWWMPMPPEAPRTLAEAERLLAEIARTPEGAGARAVLAAGMTRADGTRAVSFRNEPWCRGAVWSLNPNPRLLEAGPSVEGTLDGVFLDSLEGWATEDLDFTPAHLGAGRAPPTFSMDGRRPVLFKGQAAYERVRALSEDLRSRGKLAFGNGVPHRFGFLGPWLDVMGTETDWFREGRYLPTPDDEMMLWRMTAFQKPYLLLLNTDFEKLAPGDVERYFQRCLFYGIFPSMFSRNASDDPYWENPRWYDRDRPLFRKYVPLIRRAATAGWQPVTEAACDNPRIWVERFGPDALGTRYFTLLNAQDEPQTGRLAFPGSSAASRVRELISGTDLPQGDIEVALRPHQAWLLEVRAEDGP